MHFPCLFLSRKFTGVIQFCVHVLLIVRKISSPNAVKVNKITAWELQFHAYVTKTYLATTRWLARSGGYVHPEKLNLIPTISENGCNGSTAVSVHVIGLVVTLFFGVFLARDQWEKKTNMLSKYCHSGLFNGLLTDWSLELFVANILSIFLLYCNQQQYDPILLDKV